jgi:hypothetical protein
MKKQGSAKLVGILLIVILIIGCIIFLPPLFNKRNGTVQTIAQSSLEKVIEINDLSTLDYTYNGITPVYDESGETLKYHVAYEGIVTAGIDITKIDISDDETKKKIVITLPEAKIQDVNVDMGSMEFIFLNDKYETETISQEAYKACIAALDIEAQKDTTLLSMAKENAKDSINALISPWVQQLDDEYTIEIK